MEEIGTKENIREKSIIFTFSLCDITQIVQYPTIEVELEKEFWSLMYINHIWNIVSVNTILRNSWSFISRMVKIPSIYVSL